MSTYSMEILAPCTDQVHHVVRGQRHRNGTEEIVISSQELVYCVDYRRNCDHRYHGANNCQGNANSGDMGKAFDNLLCGLVYCYLDIISILLWVALVVFREGNRDRGSEGKASVKFDEIPPGLASVYILVYLSLEGIPVLNYGWHNTKGEVGLIRCGDLVSFPEAVEPNVSQ